MPDRLRRPVIKNSKYMINKLDQPTNISIIKGAPKAYDKSVSAPIKSSNACTPNISVATNMPRLPRNR